jgi:hypothetical protein
VTIVSKILSALRGKPRPTSEAPPWLWEAIGRHRQEVAKSEALSRLTTKRLGELSSAVADTIADQKAERLRELELEFLRQHNGAGNVR